MAGRLDDALAFDQQALRLRGQRQQLLASNIANADTPNYKARDLDFGKAMQSALSHSVSAVNMKLTNPGHMDAEFSGLSANVVLRKPTQNNLDGNTVDMDVERNAFTENALHYEADVNEITSKIKGLLGVLQGG
jgi:flagellar basal-body rod protein FlgB